MIEGQLEKLLVDYFQESSKKQLLVMHERTLAEAVRAYVEKMHDEAFSDVIPYTLFVFKLFQISNKALSTSSALRIKL